ncbi:MAG: protein tyrosine phosphatase [Peptococcaceae bacterium BICA1-7]|nr:MAG: protein tyrosine phosphatase [Peptococcaceae bacterium BICA1-7]
MKVLFVCTGNTCRSSMAGAIAARELEKRSAGHVQVMSAGTSTISGLPATEQAVLVMQETGIDLKPHRTMVLDKKLVEEAHLILTMTAGHRQEVLRICPEASGKVYLLSEYAGLNGDVMDPYGGILDTYRRAADQIETLVALAVDRLLRDS